VYSSIWIAELRCISREGRIKARAGSKKSISPKCRRIRCYQRKEDRLGALRCTMMQRMTMGERLRRQLQLGDEVSDTVRCVTTSRYTKDHGRRLVDVIPRTDIQPT